MLCQLDGCKNTRTARAKYCSPRCRRLVFNASKKNSDGFTGVAPKVAAKPKIMQKIKGAKAYVEAPSKSTCGHPLLGGRRCLQKSCYGVSKKA